MAEHGANPSQAATGAGSSPAGLLQTVTGRVARIDETKAILKTENQLVSPADGSVTAYSDNGGKLLTNCRVVLIFWGSAWSSTAFPVAVPSFTDCVAALTDTLSGPWATQLGQYRGIGPVTLEQTDLVTDSSPNASFSDSDITQEIENRIMSGAVPAPDSSIDRVYAVILPTGVSTKDHPGDVGYHGYYDRSDGTRAYWAWVTNDGTLTGGNSIPKVFSHELAEACTDPDLGSGIIVNNNAEIGDVCNSTWQIVNGHAEEAYWSQADQRCVVPVRQSFPQVAGNPSLVQSRFGTQGNFEVVVPDATAGLFHTWRNNDNRFMPWGSPAAFGQVLGAVTSATMIESNYGFPGNLEVVCNAGGQLQFFWRDSGPAFAWNGPFAIEAGFGVTGNPVLIQSRFGTQGNFELVVPSVNGGLIHFWRNNDDPNMPWSGPTYFGQSLGLVTGVTMIQSNYGSPGNLEVVCIAGGQLQFFWRDSGPAFTWNGPYPIEAGFAVTGNPCLIQSRFGAQGNFELVVPSANGGLIHFWRNNDDPNMPWSGPTYFGQGLGTVTGVTMIESNYGSPGNLEVVCNAGGQMQFFWRDSGPAFTWNGPYLLAATAW